MTLEERIAVIHAPDTHHFNNGEGDDLYISGDGSKIVVLTTGHDGADFDHLPLKVTA